jgi:hypothetical protein
MAEAGMEVGIEGMEGMEGADRRDNIKADMLTAARHGRNL